jgi:hypothetical protein
MVAMGIMLVGLLGLLATADLAMDVNTRDHLRDEAVRVGEQAMNSAKNLGYDNVVSGNQVISSSSVRGISKNYNVTRTVEALPNSKHISIVVNWSYKGQQYYHGVDSVLAP